jgi:hypothetical protein
MSFYRYCNFLYSGWYGRIVKNNEVLLLLLLLFLLLLHLYKHSKTTGVWDCYEVDYGRAGVWDFYDPSFGNAGMWDCYGVSFIRAGMWDCCGVSYVLVYEIVMDIPAWNCNGVALGHGAFEIMMFLLDMVLGEGVILSRSDISVWISRFNVSQCRRYCNIWLCTFQCFLQFCTRVPILLHCLIACYNTLVHHVISLFGLMYGCMDPPKYLLMIERKALLTQEFKWFGQLMVIEIYTCIINQHDALLIFTLLNYYASACFGSIYSPSSGGSKYICEKLYLFLF